MRTRRAVLSYFAGVRLLFPAALPSNVLDLATGTVFDPQHARQAYNIAEPADLWLTTEPFVTIYPPTLSLGDEIPDALFFHGTQGEPFVPSPPRAAIADEPRPPYDGELPLTSNILEASPTPVADVPSLPEVMWPNVRIPYQPNLLNDTDAVELTFANDFAAPTPIIGELGYHTQPTPMSEWTEAFHFANGASRPAFFDMMPTVEEHPWSDADLIGETGLLGGTGPDVLDEPPPVLTFPIAWQAAA